jgi:hypothetical protein
MPVIEAIPALEKAESLLNFAQKTGSPLNTFVVALSHTEAMDLLAYYEAQFDNELFHADVAEARRTNDPWPVLANFELFGFAMAPIETLN